MFTTRRFTLAALALALALPAAGCRHKQCCKSGSSSLSSPCCESGTLAPPPPTYVPAPTAGYLPTGMTH